MSNILTQQEHPHKLRPQFQLTSLAEVIGEEVLTKHKKFGGVAVKWDQVFLGQQGQKLVLSDALAVQSQGLKYLIGYQGRKVSRLLYGI